MADKQQQWLSDLFLAHISGPYTFQYSYDIPLLTPGVEYEAQVQATNKFGWSQRSEAVRFVAGSEERNTLHCEYNAYQIV